LDEIGSPCEHLRPFHLPSPMGFQGRLIPPSAIKPRRPFHVRRDRLKMGESFLKFGHPTWSLIRASMTQAPSNASAVVSRAIATFTALWTAA
jgi:hypothetical protein